jgi:ADP-heptose:LPS heptosyltransferase
MEPKSKTLVIDVAGIGDFVEAVQSLKALRETCQQGTIWLLTSPRVYPYAQSCPYIDRAMDFGGTLRQNLACALSLRGQKFDVVMNLKAVATLRGRILMAALFWVVGGTLWVGKNSEGRGCYLDPWMGEPLASERNQAEYCAGVVELLGVTVRDPFPGLWCSEAEKSSVEALLGSCAVQEGDILVGLNPGSFRETRRWFSDRFARVADHLAEKKGVKVLILGGPREEEIAEEIAGLAKQDVIVAAGKTGSIGEMVALIGRLNLLVTTNSAAMHVAGAQGVPLVGLIGPGNIKKDRPSGDRAKQALLLSDEECVPCYNFSCDRMDCMKGITVEDVLKAADGLI